MKKEKRRLKIGRSGPGHGLDDAPLNEIDGAWIAEAERRYEEWKAGKTKGVEGEEFFADLRRELGCG
jgi:hypothetical protein